VYKRQLVKVAKKHYRDEYDRLLPRPYATFRRYEWDNLGKPVGDGEKFHVYLEDIRQNMLRDLPDNEENSASAVLALGFEAEHGEQKRDNK